MNNCTGANACNPPVNDIESFQSWSDIDDIRSSLRRSRSFEHVEHDLLDSCSEVHVDGPASWDMCSSMYNAPPEENMNDRFKALSVRNNLPDMDNSSNKTEEKRDIKTELFAKLNNFRHGFILKTKTQFSYDHPIILLGNLYHRKSSSMPLTIPHDFRRSLIAEGKLGMEEFKRDIYTRIRFTYRQNMHPLPNSDNLKTDLGWGCMLRVGQMMLGFAISQHLLNRSWRLQQNSCELSTHRSIIELFNDYSEPLGPLSIHAMIEIARNYGKKAKDWFGPATMACIIKDCIEDMNTNRKKKKCILEYSSVNPLSRFCVYIAENCTVFMKDVEKLAMDGEGNWKSVLILIPVRLGGEKLNRDYAECLKGILSFDGCAGVLGGKPRHSVWVCGSQEDEFIYLDPHLCQESVNLKDEMTSIETFHCREPRKMSFGKLDPSCTICFICKSRQHLSELRENIQKYCITKERRNDSTPPMKYPVFSIIDKESTPAQALSINRNSRDNHFEDFVLL